MRPLTVLHLDERVLVCAKPPGMLTVPAPRGDRKGGDTILADRLRQDGHGVVFPAHRIDKETSGVVVCARDKETRDRLMGTFKRREVEKTYLAIVQGHPKPAEGTLRFPIKDLGALATVSADGQAAETRYRTRRRLGPCALVEVDLLTGRHNQIRLHFAHIGHALVGERKYARGAAAIARHKRAALHASRIQFVHPWSGELIVAEAPIPKDLENLVAKLAPA